MSTQTLTGRTRLRVQHPLFGDDILVLQVEVAVGADQSNDDLQPSLRDGYTVWRDARVTDVTTAKINMEVTQ